MKSSELADALQHHGAVLAQASADGEQPAVLHFGNAAQELAAIEAGAVTAPVQLIRIVATGKDRAKFLHNFCTNDIKGLLPGQYCEAFFTDVKARVIAHGYVLALPEHHEIWMLPGEEQWLVNHLNRYIITEDVSIEPATDHTTFAVMGATCHQVVTAAGFSVADDDHGCAVRDDATVLQLAWARVPVLLVSIPSGKALDVWHSLLASGGVASGEAVFEHLRIEEGFPRVGIDITNDHLAPEGNRNTTAVSYTKGCYLGQEPIARLDAMGHVNRRLFTGTANPKNEHQVLDDAPVINSASVAVTEEIPVLMMHNVRASSAQPVFAAQLPNGMAVEVTLDTKS